MHVENIGEILSDLDNLDKLRGKLHQAYTVEEDPPSIILVGYMWYGESVHSMQRLLARYKHAVNESDYYVAYTIFQLRSKYFKEDMGTPTDAAIEAALQWAKHNPISRNPMFEAPDTEHLTQFIMESTARSDKKITSHPH